MSYSLSQIASLLQVPGNFPDVEITELLLDSRKLSNPSRSLFFALRGDRRNGHQFIPDLYRKGVRCFVVSDNIIEHNFSDAHFLHVSDTLAALQALAAAHRQRFMIPVLGITGSNGKTIVKEWLYQCLHPDHRVVRSPRSYNSQIGVPLSIWQMDSSHELALFEAGISRPGEMDRLEKMIRPAIGILTNIGDAHNEGFADAAEKLEEKLKLFAHCAIIIGKYDDLQSWKQQQASTGRIVITWGSAAGADWVVKDIKRSRQSSSVLLCAGATEFAFEIPFTDDASVENAITCFVVLHQLGIAVNNIVNRLARLQSVDMRLQLLRGINHCTVINDSYSADLNSLAIALQFMQQQAGMAKKTLVISDFMQSARDAGELYAEIYQMATRYGVSRIIGIGNDIGDAWQAMVGAGAPPELVLFEDTNTFIRQFKSHWFRDETILVKGARVFGFEQIVALLELKAHQTLLEINLNAVAQNVKVYQQQLRPNTRVMAMVKAFAYGSGAEIAGVLQYHKVDYLGVAYADEGVELRKAGIHLPVMVMNPEQAAFEQITEHNLQPVIFSPSMLSEWESYLEQEGRKNYPVHIEIETGMNRLGFAEESWEALADHLSSRDYCRVQTVFSHLAASEDVAEDNYTFSQLDRFNRAAGVLAGKLPYPFLRHISNTAAISRLPQLQLDMVRLGIGMYGVDSAGGLQNRLLPAATLRSSIAQLKHLKAGDTVGYGRRGRIEKDSVIATVRIGYADGFPRRLGNGRGQMWVRGGLAPVVGSVCMDMTMIDVTDIAGVKEGDDVIIFGRPLPVAEVARCAETIPYEIMTGISQRVKRVYFEE